MYCLRVFLFFFIYLYQDAIKNLIILNMCGIHTGVEEKLGSKAMKYEIRITLCGENNCNEYFKYKLNSSTNDDYLADIVHITLKDSDWPRNEKKAHWGQRH